MPAVKFIFVDDNGTVFGSTDKPTAEDLQFARVGMLTIVSLLDGTYYGCAGKWLPIPASRIVRAEKLEGGRTRPFHVSASRSGCNTDVP